MLDQAGNRQGTQVVWLIERFEEIRDQLESADRPDSASELVMPVRANVEFVDERIEKLQLLSSFLEVQVHGDRPMPLGWQQEKKKMKPVLQRMREVAAQYEEVISSNSSKRPPSVNGSSLG